MKVVPVYTVLAAVCELWTNLPDEHKNKEDKTESTASLKELNEIYKENCAQVRARAGQGRAGQGRAGQARAGQGRAGQGQGRARQGGRLRPRAGL